MNRDLMEVKGSILDLIGSTPLIELRRFSRNGARILLKLEYLNPTGSHKDRAALYMIEDAERRYDLKPGSLVVEASSGNMAISVALIAKLKGYRAAIVVPEGTSSEKISLIKLLGAKLVEGSDDPDSPRYYKKVAEELAERENGVFLNQFENKMNIIAHYETTGAEIWKQTGGEIDAFVMGIGTGGTIMGAGKYLKERKKELYLVGVVPRGSPLAGGVFGDRIEGLLYSDLPSLLDQDLIDELIEVSLEDSVKMSERLAREEGVLAGPSTGANLLAALRIAEKVPSLRTIVTIAADSMLKYSSIFEL